MDGFSDPPLVAAVSNAGGLGTLGAAIASPGTGEFWKVEGLGRYLWQHLLDLLVFRTLVGRW